MLGNIKSNKTLWMIIGLLILTIMATLITISSIPQKIPTASSDKTVQAQQSQETSQPLTDEQLTEIAQASIDSEQEEFAGLVDNSLLEQPVPGDPALIKDELGQLKEIQSQLDEQKNMLEQQHKDADQLLELKEQQLRALERQLSS